MKDVIWTGDSYIPNMGTLGDLFGGSNRGGGGGSYGDVPRWFKYTILVVGVLLVGSFIYWVHKSNVEFDKCMKKNHFQTYCEYFSREDH